MSEQLPLPEPAGSRLVFSAAGNKHVVRHYTAEQMHAYAAQAVAAERERWTEAVMAELDGNGQAQAIVAYATRA